MSSKPAALTHCLQAHQIKRTVNAPGHGIEPSTPGPIKVYGSSPYDPFTPSPE